MITRSQPIFSILYQLHEYISNEGNPNLIIPDEFDRRLPLLQYLVHLEDRIPSQDKVYYYDLITLIINSGADVNRTRTIRRRERIENDDFITTTFEEPVLTMLQDAPKSVYITALENGLNITRDYSYLTEYGEFTGPLIEYSPSPVLTDAIRDFIFNLRDTTRTNVQEAVSKYMDPDSLTLLSDYVYEYDRPQTIETIRPYSLHRSSFPTHRSHNQSPRRLSN